MMAEFLVSPTGDVALNIDHVVSFGIETTTATPPKYLVQANMSDGTVVNLSGQFDVEDDARALIAQWSRGYGLVDTSGG